MTNVEIKAYLDARTEEVTKEMRKIDLYDDYDWDRLTFLSGSISVLLELRDMLETQR